uniref:Uncharacterized protein n=1 Tax=Cyclophora tenuis TaxID=216820 RepID=A0A7S1D7B1_CYCTE|mmetsp:Transcript_23692/g.40190  ORF Transcript_23692/g.40190 Transcript_23692/m.40190 type:complete len:266 (+) Transcript_23692:1025-1822(+)
MSKDIPSAEAIPATTVETVEVIAPATLQAGYTFDAVFKGKTIPVTVPEGGVQRGDKMTITFQQQIVPTEATPLTGEEPIEHTTRGEWKDGLCECCKYSCCHPSFMNAWCCPQILMAQVLTRLRMNWLGDAAPESQWKQTFCRIVILVVLFIIITTITAPPPPKYNNGVAYYPGYAMWKDITYHVVTVAFGLYYLIVLCKTRRAVREKYDIPPDKRCGDCEDFCCAFWCACCTVAQVARQTADYDQRRAVCCSDTGLPADTPVIIV